MTDRLLDALHPWTSFVIIPVFALANAGVSISADRIGDAASSRVTLGVIAGLVLGKALGVSGGIALAVRTGIGSLPDGVRRIHVVGLSLAAGVGFTVSIFVTGLAFTGAGQIEEAKLGILVASALASALSILVLGAASRADRRDASVEHRPP
jgi:Na+/H+ antiporter NhaA